MPAGNAQRYPPSRPAGDSRGREREKDSSSRATFESMTTTHEAGGSNTHGVENIPMNRFGMDRGFGMRTLGRIGCIVCAVALLVGGFGAQAELILLRATEFEGIESWKEGQSWGAGNFFSTDGSSVSKTVVAEGGEYEIYARIFASPSTDADIRFVINDHVLIPPMQARVHKLVWVRLASVVLPPGEVTIRVDPPTAGQASNHNFQAIALASDRMDDRVGRTLDFSHWLRHELLRLEGPRPAPRTAEEVLAWQEETREKFATVLGLNPLPERTPLNAFTTGTIDMPDYTIEKVAFESRPNHVVPALLYLPKNVDGPVPAVISAIGHWSYGKSSNAPQQRGIGFAKQGYALLSLEAAYAWERGIPGNSEGYEPIVSGGAIAGHLVWDIMRGADYLQSRDDIDGSKLAVTGASGGGLQASYAGALDERFKAVLPAVALWSMPEMAVGFYYSTDNWVPGLSLLGGMGKLVALTAPRAVLMMSTDADYASAFAQEVMIDAVRPHYRLLGAGNRLQHTIEKAGHSYTQRMREDSYAFLDRWVRGTGDGFPVAEDDFSDELFDQEDPVLFVFEGGKIPTEGAETVTSIWRARAAELRAELPERPANLAERVSKLLNMPEVGEPPVSVTDRGFLVGTEPSLEIAVYRMGSGPRAVVWLGEEDFETESQRPELQAMSQHATVFVVEPRGAGMPGEMHILRHGTVVLGRPLTGMWAYDLMCAVDHIASTGEFEWIGVAGNGGEKSLSCILAGLFDDRIDAIAVNNMFSSFVQLVGYHRPEAQIHGILQVADVEHLVDAIGADRVRLNNTHNSEWAGGLRGESGNPGPFFVRWAQGRN